MKEQGDFLGPPHSTDKTTLIMKSHTLNPDFTRILNFLHKNVSCLYDNIVMIPACLSI